MENPIMKIILAVNLLGCSKVERQSLEILVYTKELTEEDNYSFDYDLLVQKRLVVYFGSKKDEDKFGNLQRKPLKNTPAILKYLSDEGFITRTTGSKYVITTGGLKKAYELENISFTIRRIITLIGILGGFVYAISLISKFFGQVYTYVGSIIIVTK